MSDDLKLLRRYAEEGDERAFAEVVRRHLDAVYSAAVRRVGGDAQLAEDVAQEVFVALARRAERVARGGAVSAWLYAATRNVAANVVRRERRRKRREEAAERMKMPEGEVGANAGLEPDWARVRLVVDAAIDRLGERDRAVVLLRFFERLGFAEIGRRLGISEDAARMRLERAVARLRDGLARAGIDSTSAGLMLAMSHHVVSAAPARLANTIVAEAHAAAVRLGGGSWLLGPTAISGVATVLAVAVVGIAWKEVAARIEAEERLRAMEARVEVARARVLPRVEERHAREEDPAPVVSPATAARIEEKAAPASAEQTGDAMMAKYPEIRRALLEWQAAKVRFQFGPLIDKLGLTKEQTEQFLELVRGEGLFGEYGPNGKFVEFWTRRAGADDRIERLRTLLGDGFGGYVEHQARVEGREIVAQLASQLSLSETPLSVGQAERLVPLVARVRRITADEWRSGAGEGVFERAAAELAPAQAAVLRGIFAQEKDMTSRIALRETVAKELEKQERDERR